MISSVIVQPFSCPQLEIFLPRNTALRKSQSGGNRVGHPGSSSFGSYHSLVAGGYWGQGPVPDQVPMFERESRLCWLLAFGFGFRVLLLQHCCRQSQTLGTSQMYSWPSTGCWIMVP